MRQIRNPPGHLTDLVAEFPGYAHNTEIAHRLSERDLAAGALGATLLRCYEVLVAMKLLAPWELDCLAAWLSECPVAS